LCQAQQPGKRALLFAALQGSRPLQWLGDGYRIPGQQIDPDGLDSGSSAD
jgi:hypothetical protein